MQSIAWNGDCFGRDPEEMMKGFPGAAGPRKGADQTVAGLFRRAPQRIVLRAADRKRSGPGWSEAEYVGQSRIVGVGSDVGPHFVWHFVWVQRAAPPGPPIFPRLILRLYFRICDVRHIAVKQGCLTPSLRPGAVLDLELIPLSRPRPFGPAGNLSLPFRIIFASLKRCPGATGRLKMLRRVSASARRFRKGLTWV